MFSHHLSPGGFQSHEKKALARTFHGDSSRGAAQPDADKEADALRRRLYVSYRPRSNARLTLYPSGSRKPQQDYREMFGLDPLQSPVPLSEIFEIPNISKEEMPSRIESLLVLDLDIADLSVEEVRLLLNT